MKSINQLDIPEDEFTVETAGPAVDYPFATIHQLFEKQVEKTPQAVAVRCGDTSLDYAALNCKANQLAHLLRSKGVKPGDPVGIILDRSLEMIIGIYAVLKSGGAYLPMTPQTPEKRVEYMLAESCVDIVLTQNRYKDRIPAGITVLDVEDPQLFQGDSHNPQPAADPESLAYIIYTSGSTGQPKGVMIKHHSVVNRILWMQNQYNLTEEDVILQKTSFAFDVSVWEMFWWSWVGAQMVFMPAGLERFPLALVDVIDKFRVSVMHFVPSLLNVFLVHVEKNSVQDRLKSLRRVFSSGEALKEGHVKTFEKVLFETNNTYLTNLYGPTEATVDVTYYDFTFDCELSVIPIGRPIDNTALYIVDSGNQLLPAGETGELCISGHGLALGYMAQKELTRDKFITAPFKTEYGDRMYKTGDYARYLKDGNIDFIGRMDHQVKIRGLRIELGEIESVLSEHSGIEDCTVLFKEYGDSDNPMILLLAYLVTQDMPQESELRKYLKSYLPEYMIPNKFIPLTAFPFTSNGKLDRKALLQMA